MIESWKTSDYEYGLTKILGQKIKEIHGYISNEYGDSTFKLNKIELENGDIINCEGEHDFPYACNYDPLDDKVQEIEDYEIEKEENNSDKV